MPRTSSAQDKPLTISFYEKHIRPRFEQTDDKFISIDERFDRIDERFDRMENLMTDRFDFLFKKIEDFQQEFTVINHQFKCIDERLDRIESILLDHSNQLKELRGRVIQLEKQQVELLIVIQNKKAPGGGTTPSNEKIEQDISNLKEEILKINQRVDSLESTLPKPL